MCISFLTYSTRSFLVEKAGVILRAAYVHVSSAVALQPIVPYILLMSLFVTTILVSRAIHDRFTKVCSLFLRHYFYVFK